MPLFTNILTGNEVCGEDGGEGAARRVAEIRLWLPAKTVGEYDCRQRATTRACERPRRKGGMK